MICAPATERPASVGDQGRKAASDVRTAQMITPPTGKLGVCASWLAKSAQSPRRSRVRRVCGNLGYRKDGIAKNSEQIRSDRELTE